MDITTFLNEPRTPAPPLGSAKPGNLYADLQSRTLWLGVNPAVDPAGAVLISDIVSLLAEIDASEATARAYTDTQITTRAPTVHTHTAAQITNFTPAVTAVVAAIPGFNWVKGMIMMWSGSLAEIGVGGLAGWSLCDGSNGTPDLRDRFILAAGNRPVGAKNANALATSTVGGAHVHSISGTAITAAQMPWHNHAGATGYASHDHQHYVSGTTSGQNTNHTHGLTLNGRNFMEYVGGSGGQGTTGGGMGQVANTNWNDRDHSHTYGAWSGGFNQNHYHAMNGDGGDQAHTHDMAYGGDHSHTISSAELREALPFYALAFIMKL